MTLTARYDGALGFASDLHRDQVRKGTSVPYISHLIAVSSLVLEAGGDEDLAIAGLLHDSLEDQGDKLAPGELASRFGVRVQQIIEACSHHDYGPDEPAEKLARWRWRREKYLEHLREAPRDVLVVSRADKLHNARAILTDVRVLGDDLWSRFNAGREGQLWYYGSVAEVFADRLPNEPQTNELIRVVGELRLS